MMAHETDEKIRQLQIMEQGLQQILLQKQALQSQVMELDSALKGLQNSNEAYRIIGNVMLLSGKDDLEKDLLSKKETAELRIEALSRQESSARERASKLQKEIVGEMKNDG